MKAFLYKNVFWLLSLVSLAGALVAQYKDNFLALLAFMVLFIFTMTVGVYYANKEYTQEILTRYDEMVAAQRNRKGFRLLDGGKKK